MLRLLDNPPALLFVLLVVAAVVFVVWLVARGVRRRRARDERLARIEAKLDARGEDVR
jgi:threonine/homoserine/homoserine lactone efflux protein